MVLKEMGFITLKYEGYGLEEKWSWKKGSKGLPVSGRRRRKKKRKKKRP